MSHDSEKHPGAWIFILCVFDILYTATETTVDFFFVLGPVYEKLAFSDDTALFMTITYLLLAALRVASAVGILLGKNWARTIYLVLGGMYVLSSLYITGFSFVTLRFFSLLIVSIPILFSRHAKRFFEAA